MKILFSIIMLLSSNALIPVHDVPIAIFHITKSEGTINLNINFDLEDYAKSLGINATDVNLENLQNYLDKNTSFQFNTEIAAVKISDFKIVRDHVKVKGHFVKTEKNIKNIIIKNTFLNNVSSHSNIIQVDLNDQSKDYRMHKKRSVINLNY